MNLERPTLRSWTWNVVSAAFLGGVAACYGGFGLVGFRFDKPIHKVLVVGIPVFVLVVAAIRVLTLKVTATPDALIVRELLRTYKLPWAWLHRVEVRQSKGVQIDLFGPRIGNVVHNPVIHYAPLNAKGPKALTVTALGAWRPRIAWQRATQMNELIERYSDRPPTGT